MVDILTEKFFEMLSLEPGSGLIQSIFLALIWMNVKSLKAVLTKLVTDHEIRISNLEVKSGMIPQLKPREGK